MSAQPLRRTRGDLIATVIITVVAIALFLGAVFSAPIRGAELTTADEPYSPAGEMSAIPQELTETFSLPNAAVPGVHAPLTAGGLAIANDGQRVSAHAPDGTEVWSYGRDNADICSLNTAWDKVVVAYRTGVGCGDVVSIDAATGEYDGTRSAIASENPVAVSSNDRVGIVGAERVELWRSDMVRTVEYGQVDAEQEPDLQPHPECTITSALTRTELLAVTEVCPGDPSATWLRFQEATPEDAREPEMIHSELIQNPDARLVSIGSNAATVYVPGAAPQLVSINQDGEETHRQPVEPSPHYESSAPPTAAAAADLPHHMTWFDGARLYLLTPSNLAVDHVFDDAVGTGVAVAERLLYPTATGISVANWTTGEIENEIPVDRGGYDGPVSLGLAGNTLLEQRDGELVGLAAS